MLGQRIKISGPLRLRIWAWCEKITCIKHEVCYAFSRLLLPRSHNPVHSRPQPHHQLLFSSSYASRFANSSLTLGFLHLHFAPSIGTLCLVLPTASLVTSSGFSGLQLELGSGGFGKVYHGQLRDGGTVAIKRMKKESKQGMREFINEVRLLGRLRHVNLVQLMGFCATEEEQLLCYEYMPNGNLAQHLRGGRFCQKFLISRSSRCKG